MITEEVRTYIDKSVLCWLATSNKNNEPNVSPKEMFTAVSDKTLLIAHLASPNSIRNIKENPRVCVSFVEVFLQKGYKLKGTANVIEQTDPVFAIRATALIDRFGSTFPIKAVIAIDVDTVEPILAPSYFLFPDITEHEQVNAAMQTYKVKPL